MVKTKGQLHNGPLTASLAISDYHLKIAKNEISDSIEKLFTFALPMLVFSHLPTIFFPRAFVSVKSKQQQTKAAVKTQKVSLSPFSHS